MDVKIESRKAGKLWAAKVLDACDLEKVELDTKQEESDKFNVENTAAFAGPQLTFEQCNKLEEKFDFIVKLGNEEDAHNGIKNPGHWSEFDFIPENDVPTAASCSQDKNAGSYSSEPVAVIGLSCRLPGASSPSEFWNNLMAEVDSMTIIPPGRWTKEHGCLVTPQHLQTLAGFLSCPIGTFDSSFFSISPAELAYIDPQGRMLLELCWESLEDAGIPPGNLYASNSGVFIGLWRDEYKDLIISSASHTAHEELRRYLGCSMGNAAARISHFLGTTGPSYTTETGCSSSICSIGNAMAALRRGETDLAIAGGANLIMKPFVYDSFQGVLSPNGHCKPFQENADGFARAEAVVVYVLKRLRDAVKDGDRIHCVLKGYASSQEGLSRSVGTPTIDGEKRAMLGALKDAGLSPSEVDWVELHGTGTKVGDPIEVQATREAYEVDGGNRSRPLLISSVKGNIGHTESVSGAASLLKVILALRHSTVPPQSIRARINPKLNVEGLLIPTSGYKWEKEDGRKRIAGISSFGITGTNAHLVVEEASHLDASVTKEMLLELPVVLPFSAKTPNALNDLKERHISSLQEQEDISIIDYSIKAATGRAHFQHRAAFLADTKEDLLDNLKHNNQYYESSNTKTTPKIAFLFPGQGCQYQGMGQKMYKHCSVFRRHFDIVSSILKSHYGIDMKTLLFEQTEMSMLFSQLCIFGVEYCLLKTWAHWGLKPDFVLGHSFGEYAASIASGALSLPIALELLVAMRTKLFATVEPGKMLVLKAGEAEVVSYIEHFTESNANTWVDIAAVNAPDQTVVSGEPETIYKFQTYLEGKGIKTSFVTVNQAFHSRTLDKICDKFESEARTLTYSQRFPEIGYVSSVTGGLVKDNEYLDAIYWRQHMRQRVEFVKAAKTLVQDCGANVFLEVGPHPLLSPMLKKNIPEQDLICIPSMRKGTDEIKLMMEAVAQLYVNGVDTIRWDKVYESFGFQWTTKVDLPLYPFQHDEDEEYWFTVVEREEGEQIDDSCHPLLGKQIPLAIEGGLVIFQNTTKKILAACDWIKDHKIGENIIFPAAGYIEMSLAAARNQRAPHGIKGWTIQDLQVKAALPLHENESLHVQTVLNGDNINFYSKKVDQEVWKLHAKCRIIPTFVVMETKEDDLQVPSINNESSFYTEMKKLGYNFGPAFQTLVESSSSQAYQLNNEKIMHNAQFVLHPVLIDAMIQAALLWSGKLDRLKLPTKIGSFTFHISEAIPTSIRTHEGSNGYSLHGKDMLLASLSNLSTVTTTLGKFELVAGLNSKRDRDMVSLYIEDWRPAPLMSASCSLIPWDPVQILNGVKPYSLSIAEKIEFQAIESWIGHGILKTLLSLGLDKVPMNLSMTTAGIISLLGLNTNPLFLQRLLHYASLTGYLNKMKGDEHYQIAGVNGVKLDPITPSKGGRFQSEWAFAKFYLEKLLPILTGDDSVLPYLFPTKDEQGLSSFSATKLYSTFTQNIGLLSTLRSTFETLLCSLKEKELPLSRPLRILEVGAGTGSASMQMLEQLKVCKDLQFSYTFTDISPAFLSRAEETLGNKYESSLQFKVFDVEKDPRTQGLSPSHYDIVIALNVLHATKNMKETLENVRTLLVPEDGILLVAEQLKPTSLVDIIFGHCEGYWRFSDGRKSHCLMSKEEWDGFLQESGYNSSFCVESEDIGMGVVVASTKRKNEKEFMIIDNGNEFSQKLQISFGSSRLISIQDLKDNKKDNNKFIFPICQDEGEGPVSKSTRNFLHLAKHLAAQNNNAELYVISEGASHISEENVALDSYPVLGLSRTLQSECSSVTCKWVDLDPTLGQDENINFLKDEIHAENQDGFVAYRNGKRHLSRLLPITPSTSVLPTPQEGRIQLRLPNSRTVRDVEWEAVDDALVQLSSTEVEVEVSNAGLNFKDLLNIMKPTEEFNNASMVGADFCGRITRTGDACRGLQVGDYVLGMNLKAEPLPSHVTTDSHSVAKLPPTLNSAEGCTLPTAFLTAYHCLVDVAHLQEGEWILIHAGSGAVGLTAIQIAQKLNANVIATAGSSRKRKFLLDQMKVQHVFNSRDSTSYKTGIEKITGGKGVHVVLNSLTSKGFKEASLSSLVTNGRFIEMSKLNIWNEEDVRKMRPDVLYSVEDLSLPLRERQIHLTQTLEEWLEAGWLKPLPYTKFHCTMVVDALCFLQNAHHIGKVVINMNKYSLFDSDSSYLITGGVGGIGLQIVKWMLKNGAKTLVLCSRSGGNKGILEQMKEEGLPVDGIHFKKLDVSDKQQVFSLVQDVLQTLPPLRGIMHLAGVLNDGILVNQSEEKLESVLKPKAVGAWNLHEASLQFSLNLEHFVLFSSAMWTLGGAGQGNYAAGNAYLEGLSELRHQLGLPSNVIHWGHWGEEGMGGEVSRISTMKPFSTEMGIRTLDHILRSSGAILRNVVAAELNLDDLKGHRWIKEFTQEVLSRNESSNSSSSKYDKRASVSMTIPERIKDIVSRILRIKTSSLGDGSRELREMGMDSLMFIELKNKIRQAIGVAVDVPDTATLDDLIILAEKAKPTQ